jgi:hypothetical protein
MFCYQCEQTAKGTGCTLVKTFGIQAISTPDEDLKAILG